MAAEIVDDAQFFLPSDILSDDFFFRENTHFSSQSKEPTAVDLCFPDDFPYDYQSIKETNPADHDSCVAGLTAQMAHSFVLHHHHHHDRLGPTSVYHNKGSMTCSPKLPPSSTAAWSELLSSAPSHLQHQPPNTNINSPMDDLLFAATGQAVSKSHGDAELTGRQKRLLHAPSPKPPPLSNGYYPNPTATHHELQVHQFNHLKRQQMLKQQQYRARGGSGPLQQKQMPHQESGMRALFLETPISRKQSYGGTGVFFPRRVGCPSDSGKKSACSTVLLPARVVQALNLNLDSLDHLNHRCPGSFMVDHADTVIARNKGVLSHEKERGFGGSPRRPSVPVASPTSVDQHQHNTY